MGIFSELKKLFFAGSSVAKSGADKAVDSVKDAGEQLSNKAKDTFNEVADNLSSSTSGLRDSVLDKAEDLWEKSKETGEGLVESVSNSNIGEKFNEVKESISEHDAVKKATAFTEDLGGKILDKSNDLLDKAEDVASDLGEKAKIIGDKVKERATELSQDAKEKIDDMVAKEKIAEAEDLAKQEGGFAKETLDARGSLLEGTDDFFSRAEKFADGQHDAFKEGSVNITQGEIKKEIAPAAGFTDHDGDGNELIDDVTIISEEE